jgi:hypothetical protein
MTNHSIHSYAALLLAVVASFSAAFAQLPADLGAPGSIGGLALSNMSADLSAHDGPSDLRVVAAGASRTRGLAGVRSSSTSRSSVINKYSEAWQETSTPSMRQVRKSASPGFVAAGASVSPIRSYSFGDSISLGALAPPSFGIPSSIPQTPLYSFLARHEKGASRYGAPQHGFSGKPNRRKSAQGLFIQSLTGAESGGSRR